MTFLCMDTIALTQREIKAPVILSDRIRHTSITLWTFDTYINKLVPVMRFDCISIQITHSKDFFSQYHSISSVPHNDDVCNII